MSFLDKLNDVLGGTQLPNTGTSSQGMSQGLNQAMSGLGAGGALIAHVLAFVESRPGGLAGFLESFRQAGLAHLVESWIGTGANLPLSPEQVKAALGSDTTAQMAQAAGLSQAEVEQHLAALLPQLIDRLTPNGQIPSGNLRNSLQELGQLFLHR